MSASLQTRQLYTTLFPKCGHLPLLASASGRTPTRNISSTSVRPKNASIDKMLRSMGDRDTAKYKQDRQLNRFAPKSTSAGFSAEEQAAMAASGADSLIEKEYFSFHVYSHKHNTHITFTKPNKEPIISVSCGNLGFRKGGRGNFDAAFQLASYVLNKIRENPKQLEKIRDIQLVLRGFGPGREAATKALLGSEGYAIKDKITRLIDSTRLKFGGTRSKGPRRL